MARRISILNVTQSGANPGSFTIGVEPDNATGNWTSVFQGKFYRDSLGNTQPFYSSPTPPTGYVLIEATTFSVVNNGSYSGRYTVYTQPSALGLASSSFSGAQTVVRVNEPIGAPGAPLDLTSGEITNISTYYIVVAGGSPIVVPPTVNLENRPIELVGRNFSGWGEIMQQNMVEAVQHFAGTTAPASPYLGQIWYDTTSAPYLAKVWNGSSWGVINSTFFAPATSFRHTQLSPSTVWTINHNLGASAPFIVNHSFFIDTGGGVKPILPSDVTYNSANQITVTFTSSYTGYALIRL